MRHVPWFSVFSLLAVGAGVAGCGEPAEALSPEGQVPGECDDRADNDQDGLFDCADDGCAAGPDCNENQVAGDCSDGADNDADGAFDCDDADCALDPSCVVPPEDACDDGADNDADGAFDCADTDCAGLDGCDDFEGDGVGECTDGRDNDGDGSVDCDDTNCAGSPDCAVAVVDDDGDGVAAELDCDDADAALGAWAADGDCDGALTGADCNDAEASVFPGATEACDAVDSDCSGSVADAFSDFDGDDAPDCVDAPAPGDALPHPTLGTLRYIPAGTFTMGCVAGRDDVAWGCYADESPAHTVTLTQAYWMMESELTQAMWGTFGYANPSAFVGTDRPVEQVSWWDAVETANAASARDGLSACYALSGCSGTVGSNRACSSVTLDPACTGWRLPTEAEWEHAARGGEGFAYAGSSNLDAVGWYDGNSGGTTHAVCGKQRNGYGLCDLTGNVWEWNWDWYGNFDATAAVAPTGPPTGSLRAGRGGGWHHDSRLVRLAGRHWDTSDSRRDYIGFRLVRTAP